MSRLWKFPGLLGLPLDLDQPIRIVGGGFAGLALCDRLLEAGANVELYEASSRLGGLIQTVQTPWGIAESAAHSLQALPEFQARAKRLGVPLESVRPQSKSRWIWWNGRAHRVGPLRPPLSIAGWMRVARGFLSRNPDRLPNETLGSWTERKFGTEFKERLFSPVTTGIYGVGPDSLGLDLAFPKLNTEAGKRVTAKSHRLLPPFGRQMAPTEGMGAFVQALANDVQTRLGPNLHLNSRFDHSHALTKVADGQTVFCVPPWALSELHPLLARIQPVSLVSVTVFVVSSTIFQGVGLLNAARDELSCLGILFNSSAFAGRVPDSVSSTSHQSLTVLYPAAALQWDSERLLSTLHADLFRIAGCEIKIVGHQVFRWEKALPLYNGPLEQTITELETDLLSRQSELRFFANWTGQISLRGMFWSVHQKI